MKLTVIESKEQWNDVLRQFGVQELAYMYTYCKLSAVLENGQAQLLHFHHADGDVLYPLIKRPIQSKHLPQKYDTISPYGYSGPLCFGDEKVIDLFRRKFAVYCEHEHIITEVIAFHPMLKNAEWMEEHCDLQFLRRTISIELQDDLVEIRSQYSKMTARNIRKAKKHHLQCKVVEKSDANIRMFTQLYYQTMDRQNAKPFYYFSFDWIKKQLIRIENEASLLFVYKKDKVIAAAIIFTPGIFAHYFLGASCSESLRYRPNHLLFDFMIETAKEKGSMFLHLGGGYKDNDGLFQFKSSFGDNFVFDYYIGKNIMNEKIYEQLIEEKFHFENVTTSYFPVYRAPQSIKERRVVSLAENS